MTTYSHPDPCSKILQQNDAWVQHTLALNPAYFENLAKGQSPSILYFGCADSRIPINILTGTGPGDIFIHRNVANQFQVDDVCAHATLEYALTILKIRHVVVCGHEQCGGILSAFAGTAPPQVQKWIAPIRQLCIDYDDTLRALHSPDAQHTFIAELNIKQQLQNIRHSAVYQALPDSEKPRLHGWFFRLSTGRITTINA